MADQRAAYEPAPSDLEQVPSARPRPRSWVVTLVAAAMVAVLLAATLAGFRFVQSDPLPAPDADPVLAVEPGDGYWPAALVSGTLRLRDGCLLIGESVALFPDGTTWSAPDEVVFADGTTWRVGQRVEGGGGHLPAGGVTETDLGDRATAAAAACADDLGVPDVVLVMPGTGG